jgi:hypothetical protein
MVAGAGSTCIPLPSVARVDYTDRTDRRNAKSLQRNHLTIGWGKARVSARARISAFILLVLGLHALPVLSYQGMRQTRWPFLVWAMYAQSYPAGPVETLRWRLFATSREGRTREITSDDVGLSGPGFKVSYVARFARGDMPTGRWLFDRLNAVGPDSVTQLRLETIRYRLVDSGITADTLPVVVYPPNPQPTR